MKLTYILLGLLASVVTTSTAANACGEAPVLTTPTPTTLTPTSPEPTTPAPTSPEPTTPTPTSPEPTTPAPTSPEPTTPTPPTPTPTPFSLCKNLTEGMVVYLIADNGKGLGYCNGCSVAGYKIPARTGKWAQNVNVRRVPSGEIALYNQNQKLYWSRCVDCDAKNKPNQVVLRHKTWQESTATRWTCEDVSDTHIRFKDIEGNVAWNATAPAPQLWTVTTW
ncbi:hypothetical protein SPRG_15591 [Saprolegnia parasitica CBS 223.65]|uniref:Ricin B lectin domain-containing protein n=1 Tax=Saprolegnia parasitica (strain CBS 223.65) TaxID=695850 RepID=A0A067BJ20_SAPPC|nr:hypothetical protein SPRG_15591 [Saprolegnia parasitica CBS 223.65]KDO18424.1 hypothetical protein SPRG_15591 [Saprolegnia parasitica CBS 223.65]|eukprot:XP_012210874.1 hypothetical protein SPRG_15591 [Saprolegnia parasitica CBS 223.65]